MSDVATVMKGAGFCKGSIAESNLKSVPSEGHICCQAAITFQSEKEITIIYNTQGLIVNFMMAIFLKWDILKGLLHHKMKILSLITYPHVVPSKKLCLSSEHNLRYCGWKPGGLFFFFACPIDCPVNSTVKAQKRMKNIVRIVHLPSVVQSELYEVTRILFVCKEN